MEKRLYFETIADAEKFAQENNIKEYKFYTPEYLENGVDLAYEED